MWEESPPDAPSPAARRPLAFVFDFIEIGRAAGEMCVELKARGWAVGPCLDPSVSSSYDLASLRLDFLSG